jgi:GGDEF domain-containing protein
MLIYVANSLKNVFYGNKIYRMGGDEFLVFVKDTHQDVIEESIRQFEELLKPKNYHVAIGVSYRSVNTNTEEMVKEAEVKMYEEKAKYYQNKEEQNIKKHKSDDYVNISTGIGEIDTMLSVMQEHYSGIYKVSLDTDTASRILMPAYLKYNEKEEHFSQLFSNFVI